MVATREEVEKKWPRWFTKESFPLHSEISKVEARCIFSGHVSSLRLTPEGFSYACYDSVHRHMLCSVRII